MHLETPAATIDDVNAANRLPPEELIFGVSKAMDKVREAVERLSHARVPILIQGEGGTGKEVVARIIHRRYPGAETPFLKVSFPESRGLNSFPLAARELGDPEPSQENEQCAGTLFVREVADLPLTWQRKLTRYLHLHEDSSLASGQFGSKRNRPRLICTSTLPLEREVQAGKFLREVFYCINVGSLHLPPLRDRRADIPQLARYLWQRYNHEFACHTAEPSAQLVGILRQHDWPGNLRELVSVMKRYVLLGSEEAVFTQLAAGEHLEPSPPFPGENSISLKKVVRQAAREVEQRIIIRTLRDYRGNRKQAARALNISYRALLYKAKDAGVPPKRVPARAEGVGTGSGLRFSSDAVESRP